MVGCWNGNEEDLDMENRNFDWESIRRGQYAREMWFDNQFLWDGTSWLNVDRIGSREVIFVQSEEKAQSFGIPYDVIIGWPSLMSQGIVEGINNTDEINLEDFSLRAPLTIEDLVDNWEQVHELWLGLSTSQQRAIATHAETIYGTEYHHNWRVRSWLFPGVLEGFNALIEGRDVSGIDLAEFNERHNRELTAADLPLWPITEDDVRQDPRLITQLSMLLLTNDELRSIEPDHLVRVMHGVETTEDNE